MRALRLLKKIVLGVIGAILGVYLVFAIGLTVLEWVVRENPRVDESLLAHSTAPHTITHFDQGAASFQRRLELIGAARKSIALEFFIYDVDDASRLLTQALITRAREGVQVRILVDFSAPVFKLKPAYARLLGEAGVKVRYYNTSAVYRLLSVQHRSHRKLLIIDEATVLTGGRNIANDYFDLSDHYNFLDSSAGDANREPFRLPAVKTLRSSADRVEVSPMTMDRRSFLRASTSALALQPGLRQLLAAPEHSSRTSGPPDIDRLAAREIAVYMTADNTSHRISATDRLTFKPMGQPKETQVCVFVDPSRRFQTILGIGGALTDAAAETFARLPPARQRELLDAYFDPDTGIGYTLGRTNIHSCDFSSSSYTYVDEGDRELKSFRVDHDRQFRIPFIKRAMTAARGALTLFCSPWSPPAFMKTNNDMLHGGQLRPEFAQSWASYFARFIKAYEREGIRIWGTTVQNEPMATQTWESCIYSAEDERDFLKDHLGPTLKREGLGDRKIIVWDHNRDLIYQRVSTILADPRAAQYVWGVGFHWYEPWSGGDQMFDNVTLVRETFPSQNLIFTEGCIGPFKAADLKNWRLGEAYGRSMINDFNDGAVGWTDWNVLLDEQGGPNHVGNYCFAPVHADTASGELTYTNSYFYIGHFSKFVRPGARRIASSPSRSALLSTAFVNPDGKVSVVVMNRGDQAVDYYLWVDGSAAEVVSAPHSIQTLVF